MNMTIECVAEAVLYVDNLPRATRFYCEVLGLPVAMSFGDASFLQTGPQSTLILFDRQKLAERESTIPAHGATGRGHVALAVPPEQLDEWRVRLEECGVAIEHEQRWPAGTRSIYFRDPEGHSLELIDGLHYPRMWARLVAEEEAAAEETANESQSTGQQVAEQSTGD